MEIGRPRVRKLDERFGSRVLRMFKRQTESVRALIPELCKFLLHLRWRRLIR